MIYFGKVTVDISSLKYTHLDTFTERKVIMHHPLWHSNTLRLSYLKNFRNRVEERFWNVKNYECVDYIWGKNEWGNSP